MFDFASRIAKLDAVSLDKEFLSFLKREISSLLAIIANEENLQRFSPEVTLLIKFIIWKFTTSSSGSTIGQKLLGIKYAGDSGKLRLLFVLEGVIPYVIDRLNSYHDSQLLREVRDSIRQAERLFKILHVLNFCTFLIQNRYPTISSRVVGLPIVPVHYRFGPSTGYSYQIRELLWHQFADFLIMTLPLINFRKMKRHVMSWVGWDNQSSPAITRTTSSNTGGLEEMERREVLTCSVCKEDAVIPQTVGSDFYCYFCYHSIFDE